MAKKTYEDVKKLVEQNNKSTNFSNELLIALIWKESGFDEAATNPRSTATGFMQITKGAVEDVNANTPGGIHFEHSEMTKGDKNIQCGSYYLQMLYGRWGSKLKDALNHFGTGAGYADNLLTCETCLKTTPDEWSKCLRAIHPIVETDRFIEIAGESIELNSTFEQRMKDVSRLLVEGQQFEKFFPHGVTKISLKVSAGGAEISFEIAGPEK